MSAELLPVLLVGGGVAYLVVEQGKQAPIPPVPPTYPNGGPGTAANPWHVVPQAPQGAQAKVDALLAAGEAKFAAMSDGAKMAAAAQMNQSLRLDPPLTGRESWETVVASASGAIGSGLCDAIPGIGAVASPLCAIGASYLGVRLEDWLAGSLDDVQAWINQNVPGAIGDIANRVGDWLDGVWPF